MDFRTIVDIPESPWKISPCERMLFVGSCFADSIGNRFTDDRFQTVVNPFGVMYNPASVCHTIERLRDTDVAVLEQTDTVVLTLGTSHVYLLKETGEIVDNCQKRPQHLFEERKLSVDECADYLRRAIGVLVSHRPDIRVILTVSPIRYRKYGFHESQLSKATLLLAISSVLSSSCSYCPAYEIVNDELRDYRFYAPDMLHPSVQAVEYIWQRFAETYFSEQTFGFLKEWHPVKKALAHRPFDADSPAYKALMEHTNRQLEALKEKYPGFRY